MGFETPHYGIGELLGWAASGHVQLPDFQRSYKWDDERIRSLLVTILRGHPMGVLMVLETGGDSVRFKPKRIEGRVPPGVATVEPHLLLLDGQQRTTSMFQALSGDGVVDTEDDRKKRIRRRYFLDISRVLGDGRDLDAAVVSIPESGIVTEDFGRTVVLDVSTRDKQLAQGLMPLTEPFGTGGVLSWLMAYASTVDGDASKMQRRMELVTELNDRVFTPLSQYKIPAIKLTKDTSKEAVATVFEKVNTGGLALNVFELLTATFAGDAGYYAEHGTDFRLGEDWALTHQVVGKHPVLAGLENTDFLQAVCLLASLKRHDADVAAGKAKPAATTARKEDVLRLDLREYLEWADGLRAALPWVAGFLREQHIHTAYDLPYRGQLVPLCVLRVLMGDSIDLHAVRERVARWFWCGVLGELYGSATEARYARDVEQVPTWALAAQSGATVATPDTVQRAGFFEDRLMTLRSRQSAAYKGVYALLMAQDKPCVDWMYAQPIDHVSYATWQVDIHHVFPKAWCVKNGVDDAHRESIVNKTPLSKKTNIKLGGVSPQQYMPKLTSPGVTDAQVDALVRTHAIDPATLRSGDFGAFFAARKQALLGLIERAMGKPVARSVESSADGDRPEDFEVGQDDPDDDTAGDSEGEV